ncbi:MAG TPA: ATP synthase F1 subunit epsilon [Polyangiaceae bacterium]
MAETLKLEIVTPEGLKLAESVEQFTAPGVEGEFGILPQHAPLLTALTAGIVTYTKAGHSESVAIGSGFAEVNADRAILLTEKFVTKETLDPVRVRLELKEVDEALESFSGEPTSPEYAALVQRGLWAATQLELHGDPPPPRVRPLELALGAPEAYRRPDADAEAADDAATTH